MKILMLSMDTTNYGKHTPDGGFKFDTSAEIRLAESLQDLGNEITLVTEREIESKISDRLVVPLNQKMSYLDMDKLLAKKYDIVFASSVSGAEASNFIAIKQGIPSVVQLLDIPQWRLNPFWKDYRETNWHQVWEKNFREMKKADYIIVNTTPTLHMLYDEFGKDFIRNKVSKVYYGIDDIIADSVSEPRKKTNDIIFISSLRFYKGVNILLYVLAILKEKYNIKAKTVVIGIGDNLFDLLQTSIMLDVDVKFVGGVSNIDKFTLIKNSKVCVQPHFDETIGTAAPLEALYCKVPLVTWDLLINRERFGDTPQYIDKFNILRMTEVVHSILCGNLKRDLDLEKGKQFVTKYRTFTVTAKQIHKILLKQITKQK